MLKPAVAAAAVAALAALVVTAPSHADHEQPTLARLAGPESGHIAVVRVLGARADRTGARGVITRTQVEVLGSVGGSIAPGTTVDLVTPGGKVDGLEVTVCCQPSLRTGGTYLMSLAQRRDGAFHLPFAREGSFKVVTGLDGEMYPLAHGDRPVRGISNGHVAFAPRAQAIVKGQAFIEREPFAANDPVDLTADGSTRRADLPQWVPALTLREFVGSIASLRGAKELGIDGLGTVGAHAGVSSLLGLSLCGCGFDNLSQVLQQVPSGWANYGPNEWMMAQFNYYFRNMMRYTPYDGGWATDNDENELAGFPSSDALEAMYGDADFRWGAGTRAMCVTTRSSDCGTITEADIFCNPDKIWRMNFDDSFGTADHWHYPKSIIHEMGHAMGLETGDHCGEETYQFNRPTIMFNNQTYHVEYAKGLHRRDRKALADLYSSQVSPRDIKDMGVESYYADGSIINSTLSDSTVPQGGSFTIQNVFVENMSPSAVSGVRLRVFLSSNRTISEYDRKIGGDVDFGTFDFDSDWQGNITRTIPYSMDPGQYYVGIIVTKDGTAYNFDDVTQNNTTWVATPLTVIDGVSPWTPGGDLAPIPLTLDGALRASALLNTTGAGADPDPPVCGGGTTPMGPSVFVRVPVTENGVLSVGPSGAQGPSVDLVGGSPGWMVAAYEVGAQGPASQPIGVQCGDFGGSMLPLRVQVLAGKDYVFRVGSIGPGAITSWFEFSLEPSRGFGAAPQLAIPYVGAAPTSNAAMPTVSLPVPCGQVQSTRGTWFWWRAPANGTLRASTCSADTAFANSVTIHLDTPAIPAIGCGLSGGPGACTTPFGANAEAAVVAGQRYLVRVGSLTGEAGTFSLNLSFDAATASNATCASATAVAPGQVVAFSTEGGSTSPVILCDGSESTASAVWFKVVAPGLGKVRATTCPDAGGGSTDEATVIIFADCNVSARVSCDNDRCDGLSGGATVSAQPGQAFLVRVSSRENELGGGKVAGKLAVEFEPVCTGDLSNDGQVDGSDLGILLSKWGQPVQPGSPDSFADLDADGLVNGSDLGILLSRWGGC